MKDSLIILFIIFTLFVIWFGLIIFSCKEEMVDHGKIINIEWQPQSAGGFRSPDVDWGWMYTTDQGYTGKSQEKLEIGDSFIEMSNQCD
jgi:hypothetical protein